MALLMRKTKDGELYDVAAQEAEQREISRLLEPLNLSAHLSTCPRTSREQAIYEAALPAARHNLLYILFVDGVRWIARIRRFNATSPPPDLRDYIMRSEVATLQLLSETKVPAPKVFDYGPHGQTPVRVGYILMEKLPGKSLRWSLTTPEQKTKVISQLADVYISLKSLSFHKMGSLDEPGPDHVGPFARESLTEYINSQMIPLGPYTDLRDYHHSSIEFILRLIMNGESYAGREVDAFLVHRFLLNCVAKVLLQYRLDDGGFYLRHADDKGDHILVDTDFNITGIEAWRNAAASKLPKWHTSFDSERSQIPRAELPQNSTLEYPSYEYTSPE
ncbi:hypothetical protein BJX64DRAFT_282954 [Aspergillus heterothallicus]